VAKSGQQQHTSDELPSQVLFVHGAGEGAHACDAKLVTSLRDQLGPGYVVLA
jgi:hypothetical protein